MNWVFIILRLLLGLGQPEKDPQLQPIAVRPDGTTCHPQAGHFESDQGLSVSCWGLLKLRTLLPSPVRFVEPRLVEPRLGIKLNMPARHCSHTDGQRSSLE